MKKKYMKPSMKVYDIKKTLILCASPEAPGYPGGPFGYASGADENQNKLA